MRDSAGTTLPDPDAPPAAGGPVVFYDEECGLCDHTVSWLMARDRAGRLRFAPLQGETARSAGIRAEAGEPNEASMALLDAHGLWRHSDAALRSVAALGGGYRSLHLLRACPRFLRDGLYRFVARNRYRWFGKRHTCRLPTRAELERLLP